ncbi:MAG: hypothetical protein AAF479_04100 [Pseudomonadota bacterium]
MAVYSVLYDLKKPGRDYSGLYRAIKALGPWWHYLESTWLVDTHLDASDIFGRLKSHIDQNDRVLVVKVSNPRSGWLPKGAWEWLEGRL